MTYYDELQLERNASLRDIKRRYRDLSKLYHPDVHGDSARMVRLNHIYDTLRHSEMRQAYDATLAAQSIPEIDDTNLQDTLISGVRNGSDHIRRVSHISRRARAMTRKRPEYWVWQSIILQESHAVTTSTDKQY